MATPKWEREGFDSYRQYLNERYRQRGFRSFSEYSRAARKVKAERGLPTRTPFKREIDITAARREARKERRERIAPAQKRSPLSSVPFDTLLGIAAGHQKESREDVRDTLNELIRAAARDNWSTEEDGAYDELLDYIGMSEDDLTGYYGEGGGGIPFLVLPG
jgi:hypothetical protein